MICKINVTTGDQTQILSCETGQTISDALQGVADAPAQPCGGRGTCGKCRVVAAGALEPPDDREINLIGDAAIERGVRLACRARIAGDCSVTLQRQGLAQIATGDARTTEHFDPGFLKYGAAVDIGTTTLAVQLYNKKGLLGEAGAKNPQEVFGADVMSRIGVALSGKAQQLQRALVGGIETLLDELADSQGIKRNEIDAMVLTGNTSMLYFLTGRNPEALSHAPFQADFLFGEEIDARQAGFSFSSACFLPTCTSAFVGADITTAVLASGMLDQDKTALLVDIGTNGEMALWHNGRLFCCATAAGPAFEGAEIACGCAGVGGAIDKVWVEGEKLGVHTILDGAPIGICGSGIIDAIAALLLSGRVDETGRLVQPDMTVNDVPAAQLAGEIYLTQKDIRSVQLAKSAICAGILTLLHLAQLRLEQIDVFYLAGGFGAYIDLESAAAIGLFPSGLIGVAQVIGNAALTGSAMMLLDRSLRHKYDYLLRDATVLDLSREPYFMEKYVDGMAFE